MAKRQRTVVIQQVKNGFHAIWKGEDDIGGPTDGELVFMSYDQLEKWLKSFFGRKPLERRAR